MAQLGGGTELRAFAGNVVYSTGANETAGRYCRGHFDLPMRNCTVTLAGEPVVEAGRRGRICDSPEPTRTAARPHAGCAGATWHSPCASGWRRPAGSDAQRGSDSVSAKTWMTPEYVDTHTSSLNES